LVKFTYKVRTTPNDVVVDVLDWLMGDELQERDNWIKNTKKSQSRVSYPRNI